MVITKACSRKKAPTPAVHCFWIKCPKYLQETRLFANEWGSNLLSHGGLKKEFLKIWFQLSHHRSDQTEKWGSCFLCFLTERNGGYIDKL